MTKLYLFLGIGGAGLAATGTGLGVYYGTRSNDESNKKQTPEGKVKGHRDGKKEDEEEVKPKEPVVLGSMDEKGMASMPRGDNSVPQPALRSKDN